MQFGQYLNDYLKLKALRGGVTPGSREASQVLSPYFDKTAAANIAGQKLALQEKELNFQNQKNTESLAWDKEKTTNQLAYQKWLSQQEMDLAKKYDRNSTIGNVINTAGSLGGMYLMKNSPYYNRRIY